MRGHRCSRSGLSPSCNEYPVSLSHDFRQQLAALVQAHDQGCGPVEREAVRRLTLGLPMTALQIRAFTEKSYPAEIRSFLDARGYHALYERDFDRALAASTGGARSSARKAVTEEPSRKDGRTNRSGVVLRVAVLATALAASGLILKAALPSSQRDADDPVRSPAGVVAPASTRAAPASPCLQSLRNDAIAWCEKALTGSPIRGADPEAERAECGDRLKVNSDTVRIALNRILEDNATYTYRYDEARERCAAAATLAAPG